MAGSPAEWPLTGALGQAGEGREGREGGGEGGAKGNRANTRRHTYALGNYQIQMTSRSAALLNT